MKNFSWWPALGLTAVAAALTACGSSGSDSGSANVRIANATLTHPSLDLLVNSAVTASATAADTVSAYSSPSAGSVTLQVNDAGGATALATSVPTLTGSDHYTLVAYESGGTVKTVLLGEDVVLPAAGVTTLRIYDAAIEAGKLDIYVTASACTSAALTPLTPTTTFGTLSAPAAVALTQGSGTWNICATGSGSKTDIRMALPVTLASATVATVLLTPASGGALLNGALLNQQGTYAAVRNTNTRVRLAAAVSGSATVAANASGGTVIDSGSVAPTFGFYTLVPSANTLNITVNGGSVAAPATALTPGGDATLFVYGTPAAAVATLVADDNRPPSDSTTTKLRLLNGITGSAGTLTLTANTSPVGVNIAPGAASPYSSVLGSTTAMNLTLTSSTNGTLLVNTANTLNANTTYSILAGGDISAPQLLIR